MTPEQITLVETSFDRLRPRLAEVACEFYDRLFATVPGAAELFHTSPQEQHDRFTVELESVCRTLRRHPGFLTAAGELGARHRSYGVRAAHYRLAGPLLLDAMSTTAGDEWTPEVAEAWRLAYHLVSEAMMAGADGRPPLV